MSGTAFCDQLFCRMRPRPLAVSIQAVLLSLPVLGMPALAQTDALSGSEPLHSANSDQAPTLQASSTEVLVSQALSIQDNNAQQSTPWHQPNRASIQNDQIKRINAVNASPTTTDSTAHAQDQKLSADGRATALSHLAQFYQRTPNQDRRCHGVWVYPNRTASISERLQHSVRDTHRNQDGSQDNGQAGSLFAASDYGYYNNHDYAELSGNVFINQGQDTLLADKVIYNPLTQDATAIGNVTLDQNGRELSASKVAYNAQTGTVNAQGQVVFGDASHERNASTDVQSTQRQQIATGLMGVAERFWHDNEQQVTHADNVAFASSQLGAHGYARALDRHGDSHYLMHDVMFTTCAPDDRKWHLDARNITLDTDSGRGVATNTTLKIKEVPVFYLPYFNFPIDDRRASGFLVPNAGFNSAQGLEVSAPYYLNLAPNYDATITPIAFTNRNPKLAGEFRYLTHHYGQGRFDGAYLPNDNKFDGRDRHHLFYDHEWHSPKIDNLSVNATYRKVSDNQYLSDFDNLGLSNNALNLSRRLQGTYFNNYLTADLRFESFQKLDGTLTDGTVISDKDRPYYRLPQFHGEFRLPKFYEIGFDQYPWLSRLEITGVNNTAYFKKSIGDGSDTEKSGVRMYNRLSASLPMHRTWGYVTPKLSLAHLYTSYDEDSLASLNINKADGSYSVLVPTVSVDSGLTFEKAGAPFALFRGLGGYQLLSPRLKYIYSPYKAQHNIPVFETSLASISYDQLLADSWFLGYDRLQDLHALTPALNYRWVDSSGLTRLDASIAEQYYLSDLRVGLDNQNFTGKSSGIAWQLSTQPSTSWLFDSAGSLTNDYNLNTLILKTSYQPKSDTLFNLGLIKRKQNTMLGQLPLSAITASAILPLNQNWRLLAQGQYDYDRSLLMDSLVGLNFEDCCIGFSVYGRHYRNDLNPRERAKTAVMAELRLTGITSGGRLNRLMTDKVQGYASAQRAWEYGY